MSRFQVYSGTQPTQFSQQLDATWQVLNHDASVFAFKASQHDFGEQSHLFTSPDGQCVGVLVGKLFAFNQLTANLPNELPPHQKLGALIQQLYHQYGVDFPLQLHGFFALVLSINGQLLAIRDAVGERPIYLLQTAHSITLSDRLADLIALPDCQRVIDPAGVSDFLSTGFSPFARTPVRGISKLYAGVTAIINGTHVKHHVYHRLSDDSPHRTESDAVIAVRAALETAVDNRFEANVKTGLLLSGGLDSSLVGALVGGERLTASYSLNFGQEYRNELEFSGLMAKHLGIPARVITVSSDMIKAKFLHTAKILDEPIGDPLTVPNIIVVEEAAKEVQLVFNGEGGDPLFGGPKNLPIMAYEAYGAMHGHSREEMYLRSYNKGHEHLAQLLTKDLQQQLKMPPSTAELLTPFLHDERFGSYLNRLMHINLRLKGAAQILPKVLKASSAAGIAVRSPLFDRQLAELAFSLPASLKLKGSVEKYILKQAVKDCVPASIIDRPKSGMLVPVHYWFNKELRQFAKEQLLSRHAKTHKLFDRTALQNLIAFKGGGMRPYYGDRLWLLLSLELWMQAHNIGDGL